MIDNRILEGLNDSHRDAEVLRSVLREATVRFNSELLGDEERMQLQDRIKRLHRKLGLSK